MIVKVEEDKVPEAETACQRSFAPEPSNGLVANHEAPASNQYPAGVAVKTCWVELPNRLAVKVGAAGEPEPTTKYDSVSLYW